MTRLSSLVLSGLLVGFAVPACGDEEAAPVAAARAFADAIATRDVAQLTPLISRDALARLELSAERASNQVGGRRTIAAQEMLQIVDLDPTFQVGKARVLSASADAAQVELEDASGRVHVLDMVLEDGAWRVRIPLPAAKKANK